MHSGAEILTERPLVALNSPYNYIGDHHNNLTTARDDGQKNILTLCRLNEYC